MVFVHARNETVRTAMVLREMAKNKDHIHSFAPQGKNLGIAQKAVSYFLFQFSSFLPTFRTFVVFVLVYSSAKFMCFADGGF